LFQLMRAVVALGAVTAVLVGGRSVGPVSASLQAVSSSSTALASTSEYFEQQDDIM
jgi:hypothetical protein